MLRIHLLRTTRAVTNLQHVRIPRPTLFTPEQPTQQRLFSSTKSRRSNEQTPPTEEMVRSVNAIKQIARIAAAIFAGYFAHKYYKNMKYTKEKDVLEQFKAHFKQYPVLNTVMAVNVLMFAIGRLRPQFARKHFMLSLENVKNYRAYTLLTSAFYHESTLHLLFNMFVLYSTRDTEWSMGSERYATLYLTSGLLASTASLFMKKIRNIQKASVGASGAIYAVLAATMLEHPTSEMYVIFFPWVSIAGSTFLPLIALFEIFALFRWKNSMFDHAAHLGGLLAGFLIYKYMVREFGQRYGNVNHLMFEYNGELNGFTNPNGKGIWKLKDLNYSLDGTFENGVFVSGTKSYGKKRNYVEIGTFKNEYIEQGERYVDGKLESRGTFKKNALDGENCLYVMDGAEEQGTFRNGKLVDGVLTTSNATYKGTFSDFAKLNGNGREESSVFISEGIFENGKLKSGIFKVPDFNGSELTLESEDFRCEKPIGKISYKGLRFDFEGDETVFPDGKRARHGMLAVIHGPNKEK